MHQHQVYAKRFNPTNKNCIRFFSFFVAIKYLAIVSLSKRQQHQNETMTTTTTVCNTTFIARAGENYKWQLKLLGQSIQTVHSCTFFYYFVSLWRFIIIIFISFCYFRAAANRIITKFMECIQQWITVIVAAIINIHVVTCTYFKIIIETCEKHYTNPLRRKRKNGRGENGWKNEINEKKKAKSCLQCHWYDVGSIHACWVDWL